MALIKLHLRQIDPSLKLY